MTLLASKAAVRFGMGKGNPALLENLGNRGQDVRHHIAVVTLTTDPDVMTHVLTPVP